MSTYSSAIIILLALAVFSVLILENNRIPRRKKQLFITTNILIALAALSECAGVHISERPPRRTKGRPCCRKGAGLHAHAHDRRRAHHADAEAEYKEPIPARFVYRKCRVSGDRRFPRLDGRDRRSELYARPALSGLHGVLLGGDHHYHHPNAVLRQVLPKTEPQIALCHHTAGLCGHRYAGGAGGSCRVAYLAATFGSIFLFIHYSEFSQLQQDEKISEQQVRIANDPLTGVFSRFPYVDATRHMPTMCRSILSFSSSTSTA